MKTRLTLYSSLAVLCLLLAASTPAAHALQWSPVEKFDSGVSTAVAMHSSGLILEFHRTQSGGISLWYRVGKLSGTSVIWGGSQRLPADGTWPNVAITKEGYVLFVWSTDAYKSSSDLRYMVGKIDPNGDVNQTISWLTIGQRWDSGFHSSIAINDNGVIVGVHESGSGGSGIYYRVGHFANPAGGDFNIEWDTGSYGIHYDNGVNPHIALNNQNEVVEVHQVSGEFLLHYHRGVVLSNGMIDVRPSQRYNNDGDRPAVVLLDSGVVQEAHQAIGAVNVWAGNLSLSNPNAITWTSVSLFAKGTYPAITTNGTYLILTYSDGYLFQENLYYSVAKIQ